MQSVDSLLPSFINNVLAYRKLSNNRLFTDTFTILYDEDISVNRVLNLRFKFNTYNHGTKYLVIASSDDEDWYVALEQNGSITITDQSSTIRTISTNLINTGDIVDLYIVANGIINYNIFNDRYSIYIGINNSLVKRLELFEQSDNIANIDDVDNYIEFFNNCDVDIEFIKLYDDVNISSIGV